jgi:hypothetical protein
LKTLKKPQNGAVVILEKELARGINIERAVKFVSDQLLDGTLKLTKIRIMKNFRRLHKLYYSLCRV